MSKNVGLTADGKLQPPPKTPNCISSMAEPGSQPYIEALSYVGYDRETAHQALLDVLKAQPLAHQIAAKDNYIYFEFRTKVFKFTDDVEFLLPVDAHLIHMRSASRVGYSDWNTNRKRLEAIRAAFEARLKAGS